MEKHYWQKLNENFNFDFLKLKQIKRVKGTETIAIADVHAPFHRQDLLTQIVTAHKIKDLYIIGDFFDMFSKSHFRKRVNPIISFKDEFIQALNVLVYLAERVENIYIMIANHDSRIEKYLFDNVPMDLIPFVNTKFLDWILDLFPNVHILKHYTKDKRIIQYIYQFKDILLTHIEKSNKDTGKTSIEIAKQLDEWADELNIKNYSTIIQAHNHRSSYIKYGRYNLFQIPCLIDTSGVAFDYVYNGKITGTPAALGYMILKFTEDRKFDSVNSRIVELK